MVVVEPLEQLGSSPVFKKTRSVVAQKRHVAVTRRDGETNIG